MMPTKMMLPLWIMIIIIIIKYLRGQKKKKSYV